MNSTTQPKQHENISFVTLLNLTALCSIWTLIKECSSIDHTGAVKNNTAA